jgi:hypothetical protein
MSLRNEIGTGQTAQIVDFIEVTYTFKMTLSTTVAVTKLHASRSQQNHTTL